MDFLVDPATLDLVITNGDLAHTTDPLVEVTQRLQRRCRLWWNQWFMNTRAGLPYLELLFKGKPDLESFEGALRGVILSTPGVNTIQSLVSDVDRPTRRVTFTVKVDTDFGSTSITV